MWKFIRNTVIIFIIALILITPMRYWFILIALVAGYWFGKRSLKRNTRNKLEVVKRGR